jgi:glycosyltransferase involved in cell wall biosynthesis
MKKRILFCGESSWLSTGFATYNREIISRIYATGKYEVAEFGSYGATDSKEALELPWKFYGNLPRNQEEADIYKSNPVNQFGVYKFDAVVADFQPDCIFDARDPWMIEHILKSQFRNNYKVVITPTVDSAPQKCEWVDNIFKKADIVTTYSRFGKKVLQSQGVKITNVTSPGVNLELFTPKNRTEVRSEWGLQKELKIIGTVMRNQKRKCFPELFEAYSRLRKKHGHLKEIKSSVLLCHTSWPDVGWDIPELIRRNNLNRHVIFTYKCDGCNRCFFSWFIPSEGKSGMGKCIFCGDMKAHMPNTHNGVSSEELSDIYNMMDVYVQPAICEGWALPIVEAKACGIPGLYSNYSAMEDHVENGGGLPIDVASFYTEAETMAVRSIPSVQSLVDGLKRLLTKQKQREDMGTAARKCSENLHNWKITADIFDKIFEELDINDRNKTWDKRPEYKIFNERTLPTNLNNEQFVMACYNLILGRNPDSEGFNNWMNSLAKGATREGVEAFFRNEGKNHNKFEEIRWNRSLQIRGFDPTSGLNIKSISLYGALV